MTIKDDNFLTETQQNILDNYIKTFDKDTAYNWIDRCGLAAAYCIAESESDQKIPAKYRHLIKSPRTQQIDELNLDAETIDLCFKGKFFYVDGQTFDQKEDAVAYILSNNGSFAKYDEGGSIKTIILLLIGDQLSKIQQFIAPNAQPYEWTFAFPSMFRSYYLNACKFQGLEEKKLEHLQDIKSAFSLRKSTPDELINNNIDLLAEDHPIIAMKACDNIDFLWNVYKNMPENFWYKLFLIKLNSSSGHLGWPDITQVKNGKVIFREIKYKDKLLNTQIDWFLNVSKHLKLESDIILVKKL